MEVRLKRQPHHARYDRATIDPVPDAVLFSHIAFVAERARGSSRIRACALVAGAGVTAIDGLVPAVSAFEFAVNCRSVMVFETFPDGCAPASLARRVPGVHRQAAARPVGPKSAHPSGTSRACRRFSPLPIDLASAKLRTGPPDGSWTRRVPDLAPQRVMASIRGRRRTRSSTSPASRGPSMTAEAGAPFMRRKACGHLTVASAGRDS